MKHFCASFQPRPNQTGAVKRSSRFAAPLLAALLLAAWPARASLLTLAFTNQFGLPDTNTIRVAPADTNTPSADNGSVRTIGLPVRVTPDSNGVVNVYRATGNYVFYGPTLGAGIVYRFPDSSSNATAYKLSGFNTFETVVLQTNAPNAFDTNGAAAAQSQAATNGLQSGAFSPAYVLPSSINVNNSGNASVATNVAWTGITGKPSVVTNNPAFGISAMMQTNGLPTQFDGSAQINNPNFGAIWNAVPNANPFVLSVQPYPGSANIFTNISQITNALNSLVSAGVWANLTNSPAMPVEINFDVGGLAPNSDGSLGYKTFLFAPLGVTNFISMMKSTYGAEVGFMRNVSPSYFTPTNVAGFYYATNANYIAGLAFQPFAGFSPDQWTNGFATNYVDLMSPNEIPSHIMTLYSWGAAAVRGNDASSFAFDFDVQEKSIAYNCLRPYSATFGIRQWNDPGFSYLAGLKHPMRFTAYESVFVHPDLPMPDMDGYHNALQSDAPASDARWGAGSLAGNKEFRKFKFYHPKVTQSNRGGGFEFNQASTADVSLQAVTGWSPFYLMLQNGLQSYAQNYTNTGWQRVHNDPLQNFPTPIFDVTNVALVLSKPEASGNVAVYFGNEGASATNLTVNFSSVGFAPTLPVNVIDVYSSNTVASALTGSFSTNLAAGASCLLEFCPAPISAGGGISPTNNQVIPMSITVSKNLPLTNSTAVTLSSATLYAGQTYRIHGFYGGFASNGCTAGMTMWVNFSGGNTSCSIPFSVLSVSRGNQYYPFQGVQLFGCPTNNFQGQNFASSEGGFNVNDWWTLDVGLTVTTTGTLTVLGSSSATANAAFFVEAGSGLTITQ